MTLPKKKAVAKKAVQPHVSNMKVITLSNGKLAVIRPTKLTVTGAVHYGYKNEANTVVVLCGKTAQSPATMYPKGMSVTCKTCPAKYSALTSTLTLGNAQGPAAITFPTIAIQQAPLPQGKYSGGSSIFPKNHQTAVFVEATSRAIKDKNFKERVNKFLSSVNKPETMKADVFMLRDRITRSIVPGDLIHTWTNEDASSEDKLDLTVAQKHAADHGYTTFIFLSPAPHPMSVETLESVDE